MPMNGASNRGGEGAPGRQPTEETSGQRVGTLRGAGVDIDRRRGRAHRRSASCSSPWLRRARPLRRGGPQEQPDRPTAQPGIPVEAKVVACLGLLGGSGSNAAGYACHATYVVGGHRYDEIRPRCRRCSNQGRRSKSSWPPATRACSPPRPCCRRAASWHVFILPGVLLLSLLAVGGRFSSVMGRTDGGDDGRRRRDRARTARRESASSPPSAGRAIRATVRHGRRREGDGLAND